jgi:hypothetical protein
MQEGKVVFAVGQIAQVRIQSSVYEGFGAEIEGFVAEITGLIWGLGIVFALLGSIAGMLIRIRQKARIFRLVAEISAALPGRGPRVTSARTGHATGVPSRGGSCG